jgi:uncharacterized OsmC-like protein
MTTETLTSPRIRNGINVDQLYGTLDAIKGQPGLGKFQFRATNRWMGGAHNRSTIRDFYGAGKEDQSRIKAFVADAGEPAVLLGIDTGPNPAEFLLHALAACLTTSIVYVAAARGVELISVESTLEGDLDVRGGLGIDESVRNGFEQIRATFDVKANAPEEKIREVIKRAKARSVVYDSITRGVPVEVVMAA